MKFQIVVGKNFKIFVLIKELQSKEDFELYDVVVKTLSRAEYMPFMQGFNKTVSYSYLFNEYIFPVQFLHDVLNSISKLSSKPIEIENEYLIKNDNIIREEFDEYINSLKFPDNINTTSDDYKYQRDSVFLAIKYQTAKIEVGTSGGKTFITYLYCKWLFDNHLYNSESDEPNKKILIVVPTKLLCNQLKKDFNDYNKFMKRPLSVETIFTGSKKLLDADIVCGTFQSLSLYDKEYFDDFGVFVCDEVHRAKAYSIKNEIYNKLYNCEYFFGMTGTLPEYKTLDYLHIVSMFGKTVVEISASELIDKGVATPVEISIIKINYDEDRDFSTELKNNDIVGKDKYYIEKEYFQTNTKRTNLIAKLLNKIPGISLILVNTVNYCTILYDYLIENCPDYEFHIIHGEIENREEIIQKMKESSKNFCIIATVKTMSTGVSINNLQYIYFPDGGKSEVSMGQSIGRLMRLFEGKNKAKFFDFYDNMKNSSFKNHHLVRLKYYKKKKFPIKITEVTI